jgi:predicted nucleic acid-binding protein
MSLGIQAFELKKNVAVKYLTVPLSKNDRKRWIENWVDKNSSQTLGIDENDLWQCAQARERNLVLVTIDGRIERIAEADPILQLLVIK